jgi:hypothetical protein
MNQFVKGRTNNHLTWVMVDATDAFTPESALSAATKIKIWGKLRGATGTNFVSSGTGSLTNDITHAAPSALGLYTIALAKADLSDASAAWYDQYIISLSATGAAYQALVVDGGIDASAILAAAVGANSRVLIVQSQASDAYSAIIAPLASMTSDIASAVWAHAVGTRVDSRVLVAQSFLSDIFSQLSDFRSDLHSFVSTTGVQLNASSLSDLRSAITAGPAGVLTVSDISDIGSRVWADTLGAAVSSRVLLAKSLLSDIYSLLSDVQSDFQSRVPKRVATDSQLSDMASDLKSAIAGVTAAVSASDMSDIASRVWAMATATTLTSRMLVVQSMASDAASAAQQANSRVLVVQSMVSDTQSKLSDVESNLLSVIGTTGVQINASSLSDLRSAIAAVTATLSASDLSDIRSAIAAAQSDLRSLISTAGPTVSDLASAVWNEKYHANSVASTFGSLFSVLATNAAAGSSRALLNQSRISDVQSYLVALSGLVSDVQSAVAAGGTVTVSNISDIASAVDAILASRLSDILSAAVQTNSRALVVQSMVSDVYSQLSDFRSDIHSHMSTTGVQLNASSLSDIRSAITANTPTLSASDISDIASAVLAGAGPTVLSASDMSDIASRVWATAIAVTLASRVLVIESSASDAASAAQQTNSRVLLNQSRISDVYSLLSDLQSDFQSRVPKAVATNSQLSDLASDLKSAVAAGGLTSSTISDIASAVKVEIASDISDILSAARKANSQILVAQSSLSDVQSALALLPATKLTQHAAAVLAVVVGTGSTTTAVVLSTVEGTTPSATDDYYNGRVMIFTSGALAGQATAITDYVGSTKTATVTALTGAPVNGVTAVIS